MIQGRVYRRPDLVPSHVLLHLPLLVRLESRTVDETEPFVLLGVRLHLIRDLFPWEFLVSLTVPEVTLP